MSGINMGSRLVLVWLMGSMLLLGCPQDDPNKGVDDIFVECAVGEVRLCYSGPDGTAGVGPCTSGSQVCLDDRSGFSPCEGETLPTDEMCDGIDNDCNGIVDEIACACEEGEQRPCYTGPEGTEFEGLCLSGTKTCLEDRSGFGSCENEVLPVEEVCDGLNNDCDSETDEGLLNACGNCGPAPMEVCDGQDSDCDGMVDEGACVCDFADERDCYTGPERTEGVGVCTAGTQLCLDDRSGFGPCTQEVVPTVEVCDGMDNDCDGDIDEGDVCACEVGERRSCYTGPEETENVGDCVSGTQFCLEDRSGFGPCEGENLPAEEVCGGVDDDCDGMIDEDCPCEPGESQSCYTGPPDTEGVGPCAEGTQTCREDGLGFGACMGQVLPTAEACDQVDNNCNDAIDEEGCACEVGERRSCYTGPEETENVGDCVSGTQFCLEDRSGFGPCEGENLPVDEMCGGVDDDCDGMIDEDCPCEPGEQQSCYTGPPDTEGVGPCAEGTQTCREDGLGFGACMGQVLPTAEMCDQIDNNCNNAIDEACSCEAGTEQTCYTGAPNTLGVGACAEGTQVCLEDGLGFGLCAQEVVPVFEVCDGMDNDCDGDIDEGDVCVCEVGERRSCYTGPEETENVGDCISGTQFCLEDRSGFGLCEGENLPVDEMCGGVDDDCDGMIDEDCPCEPGESQGCYTGPPDTEGVEQCIGGTQVCREDGLGFGACMEQVLPDVEVCDGQDNDCDGNIDEGDVCVCEVGEQRSCYTGSEETENVGDCVSGTQFCLEDRSGFGPCEGENLPVDEMCGGVDDDCDGMIDEDCPCEPGESQSCYTGPPDTAGVGQCAEGTQVCREDGSGFGPCEEQRLPLSEECDRLDNNCNGEVDETCPCEPGTDQACYTGPNDTLGVGPCTSGRQVCVEDGSGFGACTSQVLPTNELCDMLDNDCDDSIDEGTCICEVGDERDCYTGSVETEGVGVCVGGVQRCLEDVLSYGACEGEVVPELDVCDGFDNDCDDEVDEGADQSEECDTGLFGICAAGQLVCSDGETSCVAVNMPQNEICDGLDNSCSGIVDDVPGLGIDCLEGVGACEVLGEWVCDTDMNVLVCSAVAGMPSDEVCNTIDDNCNGLVDDLASGEPCGVCEDVDGVLPEINQPVEALTVLAKLLPPYLCTYDVCRNPLNNEDRAFPSGELDTGFGLPGPFAVRTDIFSRNMGQTLSGHANRNDLGPGNTCDPDFATVDFVLDVPEYIPEVGNPVLVLGGWTPDFGGTTPEECGVNFDESCSPEEAFALHIFDDGGCEAVPGRVQVRVINASHGSGGVVLERRIQTSLSNFDRFPFGLAPVEFGEASVWIDLPVHPSGVRVDASAIGILRADATELGAISLQTSQASATEVTARNLYGGSCTSIVIGNDNTPGRYRALFVVERPTICGQWISPTNPPLCEPCPDGPECQEICDDDVDNNNDMFADCADEDCAMHPACL